MLRLLVPFLPVAAAVFAALAVSLAGFTERSLIGTALEDYFYGFFFRNYPLFLFALVYGAVRIVMAAVAEPGPRKGLRAVSAPLAVALFLAAGLYPTFGGFMARPAFATGGMTFLQGQAAASALVLGAGAGAVVFGLCLGLGVLLARVRIAVGWKAFGRALLSLLALWLGAVVLLGLPDRDLLGGWPLRPLEATSALRVMGVVLIALLPHAALSAWMEARRAPRGTAPDRGR